ncbi:MAG: hypothetical protein J6C19_11205 [Lachnospiraceae bacterium]|nr:hypothetical protein [Lachnospiraceae bacterium]
MREKLKKCRKIVLMLVCILTVGLLGGCTSSKDAESYLQALLDASYKNDSKTFVEIRLGTQEEAQALYNQGIDTGVSAFCSSLGVDEEYQEEFRQIYMDMLAKVRYTVGSAQKQSDGSFAVTVSYEKMNIFKPALELYQSDVAAMANEWAVSDDGTPSEEEMMREVILAFKKSMETVLAEVQYDEAETMIIRIELADNVYTPNAEDVAKLEKALFDGE